MTNNQKGFMTFDFVFALMLSLGFAMVFFCMAITLSIVEAAQYVTFATSRAYLGAHESEQQQRDLAISKYQEIMKRPAMSAFLGKDWMKLGEPELGDFYSSYPGEPGADDNTFVGARIPLDAVLLHMNIPFLGKMTDEAEVGKAVLNSYLMREVSSSECREGFNRGRYDGIKNLGYSPPGGGDAKLITDNGC